MSQQPTVQPFANTDPEFVYDGSPGGDATAPQLTITIPVHSDAERAAEKAQRTIERIWELATLPTEVVVVDNGSPHEVPLAAKVYRYAHNRGVAKAWNAGVSLSTTDVLVFMASDCRVEPGWDEALYTAAASARRIAFPYTDHCDARGFVQPDEGATAGWCFMMTRAVQEEVGVFDEWFNPAHGQDTDYWHRAWELGIELVAVPAARVIHAPPRSAVTHAYVDWLPLAHRHKYSWKHGVDPRADPPFYNREIVEYS